MESKLNELKARLREIDDLSSVVSLLYWDLSTYMPPAGATARGRQTATIARIIQEKFTDPAIGRLLDDLQPYADSLPYESDDASLLRITRRGYEREIKVPPDFVARAASHSTESFQNWTKARPANDFQVMVPYLEKSLNLTQEYANYFPGYAHIADPLIDRGDTGMTVAQVSAIFADLRAQLAPLVQAVLDKKPIDDSCLYKHFPGDQQIAVAQDIVVKFGYDFDHGRIDRTHHPFATKFSIADVRITTRTDDNHLGEGIFATMHEAGHGMVEQGAKPEYEGTRLAGWEEKSFAMHESQSLLWENVVGRSRNFWEYYYPHLQAAFPEQLVNVELETFYAAINKVQRSLIRTDADELTYSLHIIIRFELELRLLEGNLQVSDLPDAWNTAYTQVLGITPPDDRDGVLQDVHWYDGLIGGSFQGYALGNILSAQIYEAAVKTHPQIPAEIRCGRFSTLHGWLKDSIYQHGAKFTAAEIIARLTGGPIRIEPYITYLGRKFGELYGLDNGDVQ